MLPWAVVVLVVTAPRAAASSSGCTFVHGPAGTHLCVLVKGTGVHVDKAISNYQYAPNGAASGDNVCDRHHEISYHLSADSAPMVREIDPPGCVASAAVAASGDYAYFDLNLDVAPNTSVCARAKNSATSQEWTPYACEQVIP